VLQNRTILIVEYSESSRILLAGSLLQMSLDFIFFDDAEKLLSGIDKYERSLILLGNLLPDNTSRQAAKGTILPKA
jgi:DNA-binding NtrC family response regulator